MHPRLMEAMAGQTGLVSPTQEQIALGRAALDAGKTPVVIDSYSIDVFDMSSEDDRDRYAKLMKTLLPLIQSSQAVLWRNELQVLTGCDGSTGWHKLVEWSKYSIPSQDIQE